MLADITDLTVKKEEENKQTPPCFYLMHDHCPKEKTLPSLKVVFNLRGKKKTWVLLPSHSVKSLLGHLLWPLLNHSLERDWHYLN